jgi:predicted AlkP superfamily phosphohydrolase/phosphomutase
VERKLVVIGLDGATFELLGPWIAGGYLPRFRTLLEEGVHAIFRSTIPWTTVPAWTSFATGKNPGKHGCYDFRLPTDSLGRSRFVTAADIPGKTFYELLVDAGYKVTLINLPVSYPPRIQETVITSLLTHGKECIFPSKLVDAIPELKNYRIVARTREPETIRLVEAQRYACAQRLFEREWDFFFLLFSGSDHISHEMYTEMLKEDKPGKGGQVFQDLDRYIGWFMDNLPDEANLLVMSDHGFRSIHGMFYINSWLAREGYLALGGETRPEGEDLISKMEAERSGRDRLDISQLEGLFFSNPRLYRMGKAIYRKLRALSPISLHLGSQGVNLASSLAYAATNECKGVYINDTGRFRDGVVSEDEVANLRDEIIAKLEAVTDPLTGAKPIERVWRKEDIYVGPELGLAPDIVLEPSHFVSYLLRTQDPFESTTVNYHDRNGILIGWGPDLAQHKDLDRAHIADLAPTILHLLNQAVPRDMDGKVLTEALRPGTPVAARTIRYREPTGALGPLTHRDVSQDVETLRDRLRGLGYWV